MLICVKPCDHPGDHINRVIVCGESRRSVGSQLMSCFFRNPSHPSIFSSHSHRHPTNQGASTSRITLRRKVKSDIPHNPRRAISAFLHQPWRLHQVGNWNRFSTRRGSHSSVTWITILSAIYATSLSFQAANPKYLSNCLVAIFAVSRAF